MAETRADKRSAPTPMACDPAPSQSKNPVTHRQMAECDTSPPPGVLMPLPPGTSPTLIGPGARPSGPPGEKWAKHGTEHAAPSFSSSLPVFSAPTCCPPPAPSRLQELWLLRLCLSDSSHLGLSLLSPRRVNTAHLPTPQPPLPGPGSGVSDGLEIGLASSTPPTPLACQGCIR